MRCTTETSSESSSSAPRPLRRARTVVVLDTNALFLPIASALRIDSEVGRLLGAADIVVPRSVLGELERLEARGVGGAGAALLMARRFRIVPSEGRGDPAVRAAARSLGAWVLTADRALRDRLVLEGTPVLYPRDRTRLEPFGAVPAATVKRRPRVGAARTRRSANDDGRRPHAPASRRRVRQRDRRRLRRLR